jgi:hypothetical protein
MLTPSPLGRGCPAAGAVISRGGTGEGLLPKNPNTRSVLRAITTGPAVQCAEHIVGQRVVR